MEHAIIGWSGNTVNGVQTSRTGGITWDEDYATRLEPKYFIGLLRESIPALALAGLEFQSISEGSVEMRLPLIAGATNQHATHQAAIIALAGDYTGGAAVASILRGVPILGVHPIFDQDAMCLWLAEFDIEFYKPSCTSLTAKAKVPEKNWLEIRNRFWAGRASFLPIPIYFHDNCGNLIAKANMTYYLKHCAHLGPREERHRPRGFKRISLPAKRAIHKVTKGGALMASLSQCVNEIAYPPKPREVSIMFEHMLKSSARLIANLRGRSSQNSADAASSNAAGEHGQLLGDRFVSIFPEIQQMVHARTVHGDELLRRAYHKGVRQVILAGAGLDFRPWKMPEDILWFELDLPEMIQERHRFVKSLGMPERNRFPVAANFLRDDLDKVLINQPNFNSSRPSIIFFEGITMYFEPEDASKLLSDAAKILGLHSESRLWLDIPTESVVTGNSKDKGVMRFLTAMAKLGEPFLFGSDDPSKLLEEHCMEIEECIDSGTEGIFHLYKFVVAKRSSKHTNQP